MTPPRYEVIGIVGLPEIRKGDDLGRLMVEAAASQGTALREGDLLVVSQRVVSNSEGRVWRLAARPPPPPALAMARELAKDARLVELILRESRRVVRMDKGILIVETHHGWICANGGVDQSNVDLDSAPLLPADPDRSARTLREQIHGLTGMDAGVIISDTFGRPWREGLTNVAIGVAGLAPIRNYLGAQDPAGPPRPPH